MGLTSYTTNIYKVLTSDEILLRYLYYEPADALDDSQSSDKTNVLDLPEDELQDFIDNYIVTAPKFDDIDGDTSIARLLFYPGISRGSSTNYKYANQEYNFEIYCHSDWELYDLRVEKICDRINELVFDKRITGVGKVLFRSRRPISAPNNYVGYQLIYEFGSIN